MPCYNRNKQFIRFSDIRSFTERKNDMKRFLILMIVFALSACGGQSSEKTDFTAPEGWKFAVSAADLNANTSRLVFASDTDELSSWTLSDMIINESQEPARGDEKLWITPDYSFKDYKPGKFIYSLDLKNGQTEKLKAEPAVYTAVCNGWVYFGETVPGSPASARVRGYDRNSANQSSNELNNYMARGMASSQNCVVMAASRGDHELTVIHMTRYLEDASFNVMLEDQIGKTCSCVAGEKLILIVWHIDESGEHRTMFIIDPLTGSYEERELPFSYDGFAVTQDSEHVLLIESEERQDVLISRYDLTDGTLESYTFAGTYRSCAADRNQIYLLDQDNTVHILDGKDPSKEITQIHIETKTNENCRMIFAKNH